MRHLTSKHQGHLVVIRISDSSAMKELNKKTRETAAMHPEIPGATVLRKLGGSPIREPDKVNAQAFKRPGFRAAHFRLPGTRTQVLMALGSATKVNFGEDDNAFVQLLSDVLSQTAVESLWVADFARLLRSIDYLSDTWKAVRGRCRYVRHGGAVIDTTSDSAEIQFLFEALSAAADARSTVARTTKGKMRAYVDGRCPFSKRSVPFGWTKTRDGTLALNPEIDQDIIRTIVQVLGQPDLTHAERVKRAADAGAISTVRSAQEGDEVRVDELSNPATTVAGWYETLDTWLTGVWTVEYELPALLHQTSFDLPVEIDEVDGRRIWCLRFKLPLPDGGFATDDEFNQAANLRDRREEQATPTGGAANGHHRKPFCGFDPWTRGDHQYALLSRGTGIYELRRRPADMAQELKRIGGKKKWVHRGWGRNPNKEGTVVALIDAAEMHKTLVEGLVEAAEEGLDVRAASDAVFESDDGLLEDLRERLTARRREAENAHRNANEAITQDERRRFLRDARQARAAVLELERDVLRLAGAESGHQLPVDADAIAQALSAVAEQDDYVPGDVADALRAVIHDLEILPVDEMRADWKACLRVPLVGGTLTIGPASGCLKIGTQRDLARRRNKALDERAIDAAKMLMREGLVVEATAKRLQISTVRRVAQVIRDYLKDSGLSSAAASMLVADTPACARKVIWERLHERPFPDGIERPYAAHVADTYLDEEVQWTASRENAERSLISAVSAVEDRGGWVPESDLADLCREADISETTLDYYVRGRTRNGRQIPPILREDGDGVALISCPHDGCNGWATHVVALPEVPLYLLCVECRRMPADEYADIVFPDSYLDTHQSDG